MDLIGWVIFLVALLFSVMLHETGHFVMAKRFGMKVTRYFVGFGPTLWSTRQGDTPVGTAHQPRPAAPLPRAPSAADPPPPRAAAQPWRHRGPLPPTRAAVPTSPHA